MAGIRQDYTEFGFRVHVFCAEHGITKIELAALAGVPYNTLLAVSKGRRAGHEAVPAVNQAMREIKARKERKSG